MLYGAAVRLLLHSNCVEVSHRFDTDPIPLTIVLSQRVRILLK